MTTRDVVIVSACRTPIGSFLGQFKHISARELAMTAGREAIRRAGISPEQVDSIAMGEVYTCGQGSMPARQVSMRIGMLSSSNAVTVNQNCASGMRALEILCGDIQLGKSEIGLAIGVENMTQVPFVLPDARLGYYMGELPQQGAAAMYDSLVHDALFDELSGGHMGVTAEHVAKLYHIPRRACDELAVMSHRRAKAATDAGHFQAELVPVITKTRCGEQRIVTDEHILPDCSLETFSALPPAFTRDSVCTSANSAGINDGAAAVVVMSAEKARELGVCPMARMLHICSEGIAPEIMGLGPAMVIPKCLRAAGLRFEDVDCWEINEAFAAQLLGVLRKLEEDCGYRLDPERLNTNGSGISLGHPGLHRPADHCDHAVRDGAAERGDRLRLPLRRRRPRHRLAVDPGPLTARPAHKRTRPPKKPQEPERRVSCGLFAVPERNSKLCNVPFRPCGAAEADAQKLPALYGYRSSRRVFSAGSFQ